MLRCVVSVLGWWELDHGNEVQVWLMYLVSKELSLSPTLLQHLANCRSNVSTLWSLIYLNFPRRRTSKEEAKSITEIGALLTLFYWTDYNTRLFNLRSQQILNILYFTILYDGAKTVRRLFTALLSAFSASPTFVKQVIFQAVQTQRLCIETYTLKSVGMFILNTWHKLCIRRCLAQ